MIRRPDSNPPENEKASATPAPTGSARSKAPASQGPGPWKWIALLCLISVLVGVPTYLHFAGGFEKTYVTKMEDEAREARQTADGEHPSFAPATARFEQGVMLRDEGDHEQAYVAFKHAAELFLKCAAYDDAAESFATEAREYVEQLDPEHPWVVEIDGWLDSARGQREAGDYTTAYECFDKAKILCEKLYEVQIGQSQAQVGLAEADRSHPSYAAAEQYMLEGQLLLEKTPLSKEDMDRARELFDEARKMFDDAKPYDETAQRVAEAVRKSADVTHPGYADADEFYRQALEARMEAHHGLAYELFEAARDSFLLTCSSYVPFDEVEAERGRKLADPESPYYERGAALMEAARLAHDAGDYETCYAKYRQAREMFSRAASFDAVLASDVADAMAAADQESELFAQGQDRYAAALEHRKAGHFQRANAELRAALREFTRSADQARYDSRLEDRAERARQAASSDVPVSFAAAEEAMAAGQSAKAAGDIERAYQQFRLAQRQYRMARFDPAVRAATARAREQADPGHRSYERARQAEQEAVALYESGDGQSAAMAFERATLEYQSARARTVADPEGGGDPGTGSDTTSRQDAAVQRGAKLARSDASMRKDTCDSWHREASITRPTLSHYEDGVTLWEAAEKHYAAKDWKAAREGYLAALKAWSNVSNRKR